MPEQAHVTSVEALESFRASLIIYASQARPALDEINGDILRIRTWLRNDRRSHWQREVHRRGQAFEQAQQAVFGAKLSTLRRSTDTEQAALRRARHALAEAETKLKRVKHWGREFDSRIEPLAKQLDHLRNFLTIDLAQAIAYLSRTIKTLADYTGVAPTQTPVGPGQPGEPGKSPDPAPGAVGNPTGARETRP